MGDFDRTPDTDSSALKQEDGGLTDRAETTTPREDVDWLETARRAYNTSSDWLDAGLRTDWERALDHFNGKHAAGSKYLSDAYKARSRLFRPKIRGYMRRREAALAAAFFSTMDVINVAPVDETDPQARASAKVNQELVQYRLTHTIPWFLTLVGAGQDAGNYGVCISKQWWEYRADPKTGAVVQDRPRIDLKAPENFRIDPASDWTNPVNTSPYVIDILPMYVSEVKKRMAEADPKTGQPPWKELDDATIRKAAQPEPDSIRQARSKRERPDPQSPISQTLQAYEMVNVHENVVRRDGVDWLFYTLGTEAMLTDPVPLQDVYLHLKEGERPWVMGYGLLETHKAYPYGHAALSNDLQVEINDLANLRMDNTRMGVIGRYFARQESDVDAQSLMRAVPGGVTYMKNPETDVVWHRPPDVTAGSFQEQDRLNLDFDDVLGSFSGGTVQSNRKLNETVGGMAMLSNTANALLEYDLRVFSETWVEPVLRQLVRLEQVYETDETILALAGRKAEIFQGWVQSLPLELIEADLTVTVNVGIGATDPNTKVQKFVMALQTMGNVLGGLIKMYGPAVIKSPGVEEIASELFGLLGYKDASRFLDLQAPGPDPQVQAQMQQMEQAIQQLQAALQQEQQKAAIGAEKEQLRIQGNLAIEDARTRGRMIENEQKAGLDMQKQAVEHQMDRQDAVMDHAFGLEDQALQQAGAMPA